MSDTKPSDIFDAVMRSAKQAVLGLLTLAAIVGLLAAFIFGAYLSKQDYDLCRSQGYSIHYCQNRAY